jgi:hypothetical protein
MATTFLIEYRFASGKFKHLPALASELVRLNVDVIVRGHASLAGCQSGVTLQADFGGVALAEFFCRVGLNPFHG